jgi:WD domain, G-beta repeat
VVLEFVTNRSVETVVDEIARGEPVLLVGQPLIRALAKEYVRQTQERLIGSPILQRLQAKYDKSGTEQRLLGLLSRWRGRAAVEQSYGPGNVVNLLRLLRGDLRGLDFSHLTIRQAYLAQVDAQEASLVDAYLAETVMAEAFDFPASVALSGDGALLATGTSTGQVRLWRVADRSLLWTEHGTSGVVWGVARSADGGLLASSGADGTLHLWDTVSRRLLASLQGHTGGVWGVALSANGQLMASGGGDGTVWLRDTATGRQLARLPGHTGLVYGLACPPTSDSWRAVVRMASCCSGTPRSLNERAMSEPRSERNRLNTLQLCLPVWGCFLRQWRAI